MASLSEIRGPQMGQSAPGENFPQLWKAHSSSVYAKVLALVPNHADAEDLFQDVAVTAWSKFDHFRVGSDFKAWTSQIVRNKVMNYRTRLRSRNVEINPEFIGALADEIDEQSEALEAQLQRLGDCFGKLRPQDQELILLRYEHGATVKSLAQRMGRSAASVYKALTRIHQLLFDCITRESE